jgi:hypothetical protein
MNKGALVPKHEAVLAEATGSDRREVLAQVSRMLEEDRRLAHANKQPAVALAASRAIAELLGLLKNPTPIATAEVVMTEPVGRDLARRIAMTLAMAGQD